MVVTRSLLTKGGSDLVDITTVAQTPPAPTTTSDSTTAPPPTTPSYSTTTRPPTTTTIGRSRSRLPNWVYGPAEPLPTEPHLTTPRPTDILPTETLFDKARIVGGYAATPGDIPWQVREAGWMERSVMDY